ncbi:hypothetical protein CHARACLAT_004745 [Characodon lateralis]|uniref:Uncharacterized protein n=1 Tax=Characodon lateralis TaxID=208331 RepID=A0ABU7EA05_9TELE|nr:hypothetical protein [Characodon lateralis]
MVQITTDWCCARSAGNAHLPGSKQGLCVSTKTTIRSSHVRRKGSNVGHNRFRTTLKDSGEVLPGLTSNTSIIFTLLSCNRMNLRVLLEKQDKTAVNEVNTLKDAANIFYFWKENLD